MHLFFIFWLLSFGLACEAEPSEYEIPVLHEGRIRPLSILKREPLDDLLLLPDKRKADWHPLSKLKTAKVNFTPFSNELFDELAYRYKSGEDVLPLLVKGYQDIAMKGRNFPSQGQLKAEYWYARLPLSGLAVTFFLLAALLFMIFFSKTALFFSLAGSITLAAILFLRIYILNRPPVASMHETFFFVPFIASLIFFLSYKKIPQLFGTLFNLFAAGILFFTLGANELDNVQAVLNSHFWLAIHVLMIVASYGVLIFAGLLGHYFLFYKDGKVPPVLLNALYLGVALLIPGTILGGIWAQQSWGRFWDWDPKESWAFISSAIYLIVIHLYRFNKIGPAGLAIGSVIGLMAISFTWYGVNYILGAGLHSYGFGQGGELYYYLFLACEAAVILYGLKRNHIYDKNT